MGGEGRIDEQINNYIDIASFRLVDCKRDNLSKPAILLSVSFSYARDFHACARSVVSRYISTDTLCEGSVRYM